MNGADRQYHEVANVFPLMQGDEYESLKEDIKANGLLTPVWLHPDGRIVDGRNRYRACKDLGIAPHFRTWDGNGSLIQFVVSLNLHRRHLTSGQRAMIAVDILPMLEAEARKRMVAGAIATNTGTQKIEYPEDKKGEAAAHAAGIVGSNRQYVHDAKALQTVAPDLAAAVRSGGKTLVQAKREVKERKREQRREENRKKIQQAPTVDIAVESAKFATIVIDPPWDWGDEGDVDQLGRARPTYATMSIDQLHALPVGDFADVDCHLYLWITNRSLPKGFGLIERWGFRYVTCITWVKPSFGMGNYFRGQTEHILFAVRGSQPLKRKDAATVLCANRGSTIHSTKPVEFYDLVESCSPGPYLEMFARHNRTGWKSWGENGTSN